MSTIVIMPGGFHPFHAGHAALYQSAIKAFPGAEVFVAASNDTKTRPFPFAIKEKLAKLAGVKPGHFVQVKSPFQPKEITSNFNPEQDVVIFVRSEKDRNESPKPGGMKKDGTPAYFQPWTGKDVQPFGQHAYMAYLPTVEFGPGITSATEIRNAWPRLDDRRKTAMVMSLYPVTQKNPKLATNVVKMLDMGMGNELTEETEVPQSVRVLQALRQDAGRYLDTKGQAGGRNFILDINQRLVQLERTGNPRAKIISSTVRDLMDVAQRSSVNTKGVSFGTLAHTLMQLTQQELQKVATQQGVAEESNNPSRDSNTDIRAWAKEILLKYSKAHFINDIKNQRIVARGIDEKILGVFNRATNKPNIFIEQVNEFALPGGDDREPDEEEILRQLAAQWWNGTEQQMKKAQQTLQSMGWEIGQDESGDDDAGVFVIRIGDEHGDSYIAFNHSDLSLDENMGLPYPATYEEENQIRKNGPMRITAMTSESNLSESLDYLEEK